MGLFNRKNPEEARRAEYESMSDEDKLQYRDDLLTDLIDDFADKEAEDIEQENPFRDKTKAEIIKAIGKRTGIKVGIGVLFAGATVSLGGVPIVVATSALGSGLVTSSLARGGVEAVRKFSGVEKKENEIQKKLAELHRRRQVELNRLATNVRIAESGGQTEDGQPVSVERAKYEFMSYVVEISKTDSAENKELEKDREKLLESRKKWRWIKFGVSLASGILTGGAVAEAFRDELNHIVSDQGFQMLGDGLGKIGEMAGIAKEVGHHMRQATDGTVVFGYNPGELDLLHQVVNENPEQFSAIFESTQQAKDLAAQGMHEAGEATTGAFNQVVADKVGDQVGELWAAVATNMATNELVDNLGQGDFRSSLEQREEQLNLKEADTLSDNLNQDLSQNVYTRLTGGSPEYPPIGGEVSLLFGTLMPPYSNEENNRIFKQNDKFIMVGMAPSGSFVIEPIDDVFNQRADRGRFEITKAHYDTMFVPPQPSQDTTSPETSQDIPDESTDPNGQQSQEKIRTGETITDDSDVLEVDLEPAELADTKTDIGEIGVEGEGDNITVGSKHEVVIGQKIDDRSRIIEINNKPRRVDFDNADQIPAIGETCTIEITQASNKLKFGAKIIKGEVETKTSPELIFVGIFDKGAIWYPKEGIEYINGTELGDSEKRDDKIVFSKDEKIILEGVKKDDSKKHWAVKIRKEHDPEKIFEIPVEFFVIYANPEMFNDVKREDFEKAKSALVKYSIGYIEKLERIRAGTDTDLTTEQPEEDRKEIVKKQEDEETDSAENIDTAQELSPEEIDNMCAKGSIWVSRSKNNKKIYVSYQNKEGEKGEMSFWDPQGEQSYKIIQVENPEDYQNASVDFVAINKESKHISVVYKSSLIDFLSVMVPNNNGNMKPVVETEVNGLKDKLNENNGTIEAKKDSEERADNEKEIDNGLIKIDMSLIKPGDEVVPDRYIPRNIDFVDSNGNDQNLAQFIETHKGTEFIFYSLEHGDVTVRIDSNGTREEIRLFEDDFEKSFLLKNKKIGQISIEPSKKRETGLEKLDKPLDSYPLYLEDKMIEIAPGQVWTWKTESGKIEKYRDFKISEINLTREIGKLKITFDGSYLVVRTTEVWKAIFEIAKLKE